MKPARLPALAAALAFAGAALANMPPPDPRPTPAAVAPAENAAPTPVVAAQEEPTPAPAPAPQHPQGIEKAVPSGVIEGGWGYVYASYAVALLGLALYALSLWTRRPGAQPPSGDVP
ncbi:MAG: hypothetical protein AB1730_19420 [Myxococcota bacterium]